MHGNDTTVLLLERAAALAVQASVARAAHLAAVAAFVVRAHAALGGVPDDAHSLEAMERAEAKHAVVAELAARLTIPELAAYRLVVLALALTTRLPVTWAAFAEGRIDEQRAAVVAHETELLSDAHAAVVDEALADVLGPLDIANLRPEVKRQVQGVDRDAVRRRAKRATADRHVRFKSLGDGMAELTINAPATALVPAYNTIEALAKDKDRPGGRVDPFAALVHDGAPPLGPDGTPVDQRSMDAHRADVAVDLLTQGLGASVPAGCGPQIFVAFPAAIGAGDQPATIDRGGDVPAIFAEHLLADHGFRRVLTDPFTGHLSGIDGHSYPAGTLPGLSGARQDLAGRSDGVLAVERPDSVRTVERPAEADGAESSAARRLASATVAPPSAPARRPSVDPERSGTVDVPVTGSPPSTASRPDPDPEDAAPGAGCPVAAAGGGPYDIAAAILRFVRARSPRCTARGCRRPSTQCDTDHRIPWPQGPTCPCNLAPLCRRHHLAKHRFGWTVRKATADPADPSQLWTSPLGYEYLVPAEPLLPGSTAAVLARERGVPTETWPGDVVDRAHPYGRGRPDWLGTVNTQQAQLALQQHAEVHAAPSEPAPARTPPTLTSPARTSPARTSPARTSPSGPGGRDGPRDDPPF